MISAIYLSHQLNNDTPCYAGRKSIIVKKGSSIDDGNTANSISISMSSHVGTHVDAPYHFFNNGKTLSDYPASYWVFLKPQCIDIDIKPGELIRNTHIQGLIKKDTDLLLIRTGMEKYRSESVYWKNSPGISSELANIIRSEFPNIRAVGMDIISVTSLNHREEGRHAHMAFLRKDEKNEAVILIEDLSLVNYNSQITSVIVLPLMIENADGAPCTVIGQAK